MRLTKQHVYIMAALSVFLFLVAYALQYSALDTATEIREVTVTRTANVKTPYPQHTTNDYELPNPPTLESHPPAQASFLPAPMPSPVKFPPPVESLPSPASPSVASPPSKLFPTAPSNCGKLNSWSGRSMIWWNNGCASYSCEFKTDRCNADNRTIRNVIAEKEKGMNVVPCCNSLLREMSDVWFSEAPNNGSFAYFGALLGAVRANRYMGWTSDNDFFAPRSFMDSAIRGDTDLVQRMRARGVALFDDLGFYRMCITKDFMNGALEKYWKDKRFAQHCMDFVFYADYYPYTDIFSYDLHKNGSFLGVRQPCVMNATWFFPLHKYELTGYGPLNNGLPVENFTKSEIWVPREYSFLLEYQYGINWRTPDPKKKGHGSPNCHVTTKMPRIQPPSPSTTLK